MVTDLTPEDVSPDAAGSLTVKVYAPGFPSRVSSTV
jgi:hypothetical protein